MQCRNTNNAVDIPTYLSSMEITSALPGCNDRMKYEDYKIPEQQQMELVSSSNSSNSGSDNDSIKSNDVTSDRPTGILTSDVKGNKTHYKKIRPMSSTSKSENNSN